MFRTLLTFIHFPISLPSSSIACGFVRGSTPSLPASPAIAPPISTPFPGISTIPPDASLGLNLGILTYPLVRILIPGKLFNTPAKPLIPSTTLLTKYSTALTTKFTNLVTATIALLTKLLIAGPKQLALLCFQLVELLLVLTL